MCKVIPIGGMTCPECDGTGRIMVNERIVRLGHGYYTEKELIDCPTCDGKGWVLTEDENQETN